MSLAKRVLERYSLVESKQYVIGFDKKMKPILSGKKGDVTKHMKLNAKDSYFHWANLWGKKASDFSKEAFASYLERMVGLERFTDESKALKAFKEIESFQGNKNPYGLHKNGKAILVNIGYQVKGKIGDGKFKNHLDDALGPHDIKYKIVLDQLDKANEIETANDIIAHDQYIDNLKKDVKINVHLMGGKSGFPSDLRLAKAVKKLKDQGIDAELYGDLDPDTYKRVFGENK